MGTERTRQEYLESHGCTTTPTGESLEGRPLPEGLARLPACRRTGR